MPAPVRKKQHDIPADKLDALNQYVIQQTACMDLWRFTNYYGGFKMVDPYTYELVDLVSLCHRSMDDIFAMAAIPAFAFKQDNGDDGADIYGVPYEGKYIGVDSSMVTVGPQGGLWYGENSFRSTPKARFDVSSVKDENGHAPTKKDFYNKIMIMVLHSCDHDCIIDAFAMPGSIVQSILDKQTGSKRVISLAQVIEHGGSFVPALPYIGLAEYEDALTQMVLARDGKLSKEDHDIAVSRWASLGNSKNLKPPR